MMCFIYSIKHKASNKQYIGKTCNAAKRWQQHRRLYCKGCPYIHAALKKYGSDALSLALYKNVILRKSMLLKGATSTIFKLWLQMDTTLLVVETEALTTRTLRPKLQLQTEGVSFRWQAEPR